MQKSKKEEDERRSGIRAFPESNDIWGGMTLRDYFAAKAMQSLIGKYAADPARIATFSYEFADEMLEEREGAIDDAKNRRSKNRSVNSKELIQER